MNHRKQLNTEIRHNERAYFQTKILYDAAEYAGAYLNLPASRDEIQDAMDRARIRDGQPYKIVECWGSQGDELTFIPEDPSLKAKLPL